MLYTGGTQYFFLWEQVCEYATYIRNRIGYSTMGDFDSPFYLLEGKLPNSLHRCRVLFSLCWPVTDAYHSKFTADRDAHLWLGIDESLRGYIVYNPIKKNVYVAGMIRVFENPDDYGKILNDRTFTAWDIQDSGEYKLFTMKPYIPKEQLITNFVNIKEIKPLFDEEDEQSYALVSIITTTQATPFDTYLSVLLDSDISYFNKVWEYLEINDNGDYFPLFSCINVNIGNKKSSRGIVCAENKSSKNRLNIVLENGKQEFYPMKKVIEFQDRNILFTKSMIQYDIDYLNYVNPKNREDAMKRHDAPQWVIAEDNELGKIMTYEVLAGGTNVKPSGKQIHTLRFVYQLQVHSDGTLKKYKVRLVFRGFNMIKDVDYEKSYAPVTQGISISLFCILLLYFALEKYALDVESAFLLPDQKTEIWCELPEGVTIGGFKYYYLNKAMYGTVDASYQFHYYLSESLDKFGFKRHAAEPCLFYLLNETIKCLFLVHVDNLLCGCNNLPWLKKLIIDLKPKMILKFENSKSILGVQITREDKITISFSQEYYIDALIAEYKLEGTPVKHIPIRPGIEKDFDPGTMEPVKCDLPYRRLNMQLMWVARMSVHHINYACVFFARFGNCYNAELYKEMLNVLLYLKKIKSWKKKLVLKPYEKLDILFHCDASYNIFEDGRTAIGGIGYINNNPIYASCKVPSAVFTSSTESESHGAFETGKTAVFFWNWASYTVFVQKLNNFNIVK